MTVRPMTMDDYEAVYALWLSCKGMGLNDVVTPGRASRAFWREIRTPALWQRTMASRA